MTSYYVALPFYGVLKLCTPISQTCWKKTNSHIFFKVNCKILRQALNMCNRWNAMLFVT